MKIKKLKPRKAGVGCAEDVGCDKAKVIEAHKLYAELHDQGVRLAVCNCHEEDGHMHISTIGEITKEQEERIEKVGSAAMIMAAIRYAQRNKRFLLVTPEIFLDLLYQSDLSKKMQRIV